MYKSNKKNIDMSEYQILESSDAPDHCAIRQGLNILYKCLNSSCTIYQQSFAVSFRYESLNCSRIVNEILCPFCKSSEIESLFILFVNSSFILEGMLQNGEPYKLSDSSEELYKIPFNFKNFDYLSIFPEIIDPGKSDKLWVCSITGLFDFEVDAGAQSICLHQMGERFREKFNIEIENQEFYFEGKKVHQIQPSSTSSIQYVSVVDNSNKKKILFRISVEVDGRKENYQVPVEEKKLKTVYDVLLEFNNWHDLRSIFSSYFQIFDKFDRLLKFDSRISDELKLNPLLKLSPRQILDTITFSVSYLDFNHNFTFGKNMEFKEPTNFISLFFAVNKRILAFSSNELLIDSDKTIDENGITDGSSINAYLLTQGGAEIEKLIIDAHTNQALPPSPDAPEWRTVIPGFIWKSHCKNCNDFVLISEGYGVINIMSKMKNVRCPKCKENVQPDALGFLQCTIKCEGEKANFDSIDYGDEFFDDSLHIFESMSEESEARSIFVSTQENR